MTKNQNNNWKPDLENYKVIVTDSNKSQLLYDLAKDKLQSTIDSHSFLERKIILLLGYLLITNTIFVGFMIGNGLDLFSSQKIPFQWQICVIISAYLIFCLILTKLLAVNFYFKGNEPKNTFEIAQSSYNKIIVGETISYQERIEHNQKIVSINTNIFKKLLFITLLLPILFLFG